MNQAEVTKLISALRFKVQPRGWHVTNHESYNRGLRGQLLATRKSVTALVSHERVEFTRGRGTVVREYTERLLQEALEHGDRHAPTMELANWWITDKAAVHKLFKVLVPRYQAMMADSGSATPFLAAGRPLTRLLNAPTLVRAEGGPHMTKERVVVELRGHPFPPLNYSNSEPNRGLIHNVLLAEARRESRLAEEFKRQEAAEQAVVQPPSL